MPPTMSDEGIRLATALASTTPEIGVVVLSQYDEVDYVLALLEAGSDDARICRRSGSPMSISWLAPCEPWPAEYP